ncbi:MAG TPA: hypothetical protein VFS15_26605 [Kofleriaceae bacterium]|nr:hypothetical protein [Kofleriaceae bacterium]
MRFAAVLLVITAVGCVPPPVYRVQRTARVPHPAAPLRTGEPLDGPVELSLGASSVGDLAAPRLVDKQASIEVPREQMRGELRIRLGRRGARGELAPIFETAAPSSMQPLDPTQAPVESGAPTGFGLAGRYSIDTGAPGFSIGVGLEAMSWQIPYVEYRTCVEFCEENGAPAMQVLHGTEGASTLGASLTPTYRHGDVAVFATAYTRRHPTIVRKGTELYAMDYDQDVDSGNYNWIVSAGIEYRLPVVSLMATVQQDLTRDPVAYAPSFGFSVAVRVPDPPQPRASAAPDPGVPAMTSSWTSQRSPGSLAAGASSR